MIKDQLFKWLFISFSGTAFSLLYGIPPGQYSLYEAMGTLLFFIAVSFVAWQGVSAIASRLRMRDRWKEATVKRLVLLQVCSAAFTGGLFYSSLFLWQRAVLADGSPHNYSQAILGSGFTGAMLALLIDNAFLSKEIIRDSGVLQPAEKESAESEVKVFRNEMDPHFFFNCMNTLSYLVRNDAEKAHQFVHRLSSVYKYFLRNKEKSCVSLEDEFEFLDHYHYLLRVRFDDNIRIENSITSQHNPVYILPCSLQVVVENAMKQNFFSDTEPLVVSIKLAGDFIAITNAIKPKPYAAEHTSAALQILQARYRLLTDEPVVVQQTNHTFLVKLPLVKATNDYDKSSDN
jgi:hypothetical protein